MKWGVAISLRTALPIEATSRLSEAVKQIADGIELLEDSLELPTRDEETPAGNHIINSARVTAGSRRPRAKSEPGTGQALSEQIIREIQIGDAELVIRHCDRWFQPYRLRLATAIIFILLPAGRPTPSLARPQRRRLQSADVYRCRAIFVTCLSLVAGLAQSPHLGDDIEATVRRMAAAGAASGKGEFETTAEYEARRSSLITKGQLTFVVDEWLALFVYDADRSEMKVRVLAHPHTFYLEAGSPKFSCLVVKRVLKSERQYLGTNAFGVQAPIKDSTFDEYGIIVAPGSAIAFDSPIWSTFVFHMDRDDARDQKHYLRFAIAGAIADGRVYGNIETHAPTVSEPYKDTRQQSYIPLTVATAKVVDIRTGQTIADLTKENMVDDQGRPTSAKEQKPPAPQAIHVDPDTQKALLIRQPKPAYPPLAKQARISGVVRLDVTIARDGTVSKVEVASGHPLLVPAALEAVRLWTYKPTLVNGAPVEVITIVDVSFP
jgi:TonB family protein